MPTRKSTLTRRELVRITTEFFDLHWAKGEDRPAWTAKLYTGDGHVPHGDKPGCYAIVRDDFIRYLGIGAARCNDRYPNYGLAARTHNYVRRDFEASRKHPEKQPVWRFRDKKDSGLYVIPFPVKRAYLAFALETFLIDRLAEKNGLDNLRRPATT